MEWSSLAGEEYRTYTFVVDGQKVELQVPGDELNVSASGGHRIKGRDGLAYYIPAGWLWLTWKPKDPSDMFQF
jgi:hypothetical protein